MKYSYESIGTAPKTGEKIILLQDGIEYEDHEWFEDSWCMVMCDQAGPYPVQRLTHPSHWRTPVTAAEAIAALSARETAYLDTIARLTAERDAVQAVTVEACAAVAQNRWALRREHADRLAGMDYAEAAIDAKTVGAKADEAEIIAVAIRELSTIQPRVAAARVLLNAGFFAEHSQWEAWLRQVAEAKKVMPTT